MTDEESANVRFAMADAFAKSEMTQLAFAEAIGTSQPTIAYVLGGGRAGPDVALVLAEHLGKTYEQLVGSPPPPGLRVPLHSLAEARRNLLFAFDGCRRIHETVFHGLLKKTLEEKQAALSQAYELLEVLQQEVRDMLGPIDLATAVLSRKALVLTEPPPKKRAAKTTKKIRMSFEQAEPAKPAKPRPKKR